MKHLFRNLGLTFFSSLLCSMAYAQDLYTILELALENDPTLKQAEAQYRANRENLSQSRSALLQALVPVAVPPGDLRPGR